MCRKRHQLPTRPLLLLLLLLLSMLLVIMWDACNVPPLQCIRRDGRVLCCIWLCQPCNASTANLALLLLLLLSILLVAM
jgi:hypothetical protein